MATIVYPSPTKSAVFLTPVGNVSNAEKDVPLDVRYLILDDTSHLDKDFIEAYEFDDDIGIKTNFSKAKEIQKNRWRFARKPLLEKLDVEYMKALESNDTLKMEDVAKQKKALRDVTNTFLSNDNLQNIKNTWPFILGPNPYV